MKEIKLILFIMMITLMAFPFNVASAQEPAHVVDTTRPVATDVRSSIDSWLATSAPVPYPYWAITYVQVGLQDTFVSLAALNIATPTDRWNMTDGDTVAWMGTVVIRFDGTVEMYSDALAYVPAKKVLASLIYAPGGGQAVRFPWQSGGTLMYGPRGVHAAGGGGSYATGFSAVDFVGGDDMGSGVASSSVYAVAGGTVDYVCADATTTLVRTADAGSNSYYIYAHLLDNANLAMGHSFARGSLLGSLKYGSFDDNCGWAEQTDKHYHLHFGFQPANNAMRLENCILNTSTGKWTCGTQTISTGQFLVGGGGVGTPGDDTGNSVSQPGFFDYMLAGAVGVWDAAIVRNAPAHITNQYIYVLYNTVKLVLKLAYVLIYSNVNLTYLIAIVFFGLYIQASLWTLEMIAFGFKAWKSLIPVVGA